MHDIGCAYARRPVDQTVKENVIDAATGRRLADTPDRARYLN
jgi:hypothetical protein